MVGMLLLALLVLMDGGALRSEAPPFARLLDHHVPEWEVTHWLNSEPLALAELRGRVVLVRFWTAPHCPYCAASAPTLNALYERYRAQGLVVVGLYHHKEPTPLDLRAVARHAARLGFAFPVAVDEDWKTLSRWWLDRVESDWTSVSFLLDRRGIVRHIHPGGQYAPGEADARTLEAKVVELLRTE